ncbi:hypothetical protein FXO38_18360 [Capsicum annuum]|nr:hypothetical protein FXO38_18360 [Capsicum annuum]KAF3666364.1 hypothetical protein FXO37_10596 [Capsicum annuum]
MPIAARDAAVNTFTEDAGCRILLKSLKSGGVSLNLTVASHAVLILTCPKSVSVASASQTPSDVREAHQSLKVWKYSTGLQDHGTGPQNPKYRGSTLESTDM